MVDKELFKSWRDHPVTQEIMTIFKNRREQLINELTSIDTTASGHDYDFNRTVITYIQAIKTLDIILEISYSDGEVVL